MTALRTPICARLGIRYPVFQAGMGWVARAELAAAVSNVAVPLPLAHVSTGVTCWSPSIVMTRSITSA